MPKFLHTTIQIVLQCKLLVTCFTPTYQPITWKYFACHLSMFQDVYSHCAEPIAFLKKQFYLKNITITQRWGLESVTHLNSVTLRRNKMQTRDNAENVVFNVPRFSDQVIREMQYRDTGQTGSRKTIKSQHQRADVCRYQGAGEVVVVVQNIKVINRRQKGKQIQRGQAKI